MDLRLLVVLVLPKDEKDFPTWIAQRIGNLYSSAIVGLLLLAALIFNISMLPYPIWFKIANLVAIPIAMIAGSRLAMRHKTAGAGEAH